MRRVVTDKIASVAQSCGLTPELRLSGEVPCEEGVVLAVEILNDRYTYNELALAGARIATVQKGQKGQKGQKVQKGEVLVGALGHRKALFGYSGSVPNTLEAGGSLLGDIVHQQFEVRAAVGT